MNLFYKLGKILTLWRRDETGVAAVEGALIFPILIFLMLATYEMGNGILADQKLIRSSQVIGDLVTRGETISDANISEAITAGELALVPNNTLTFGVDIVSIRFDNDSNPTIVWRETRNMTADADVLESVESLAEPNGGVVVTIVQYTFEPLFGDSIIGDITMQETAFTRGRASAVVYKS